jgi:phospholipase/carboxylesterase
MNRLFAEPAPPALKHKPQTQVHKARLPRPVTMGEALSLFAPLHYEANYAYPLLLWLHSAGGDERQLARVMPLVSMRNYVGLAVRGPVAAASRGFAWPQTAEAIDAAEQRILESIDKACEKYHVHRQRVFLAGYESGGTMAYRVALRNPDRFAAAVSIGGPFPQGNTPLARIAQLRKFPLLLAHCRDSQGYPVERVCDELRLFHAAGLAVTLRQYPCGDELTTKMLHDLDVWLMQHVTGVAAAESPDPAETRSEWN